MSTAASRMRELLGAVAATGIAALGFLVAAAAAAFPIDGTILMSGDVVFPPTPVEEFPVGIEYRAETGPTGGPYRPTSFFNGVLSTEGSGYAGERDNVWCLSYNFDHCTGAPILSDEQSFHWTWEASYKSSPLDATWIENNVDVRYPDGSYFRPWAFHINADIPSATLQFLPAPDVVKFQINQNGNVVIGTPFRQPIKQLEVVGSALVTQDLQVDGTLTVGGRRVLTGPILSSARFKEQIRDMGNASDVVGKLRPVTFRYRKGVVDGERADLLQYGLIAEEVAQVAPELVVFDEGGQPYAVLYHALPSLLVNEVQEQQRAIDGQAAVIEEQRQQIAALASRLDAVEQKLAAPLEADQ